VLKGRFDESQRPVKSSTRVGAQLSPDGGRLLLVRNLPSSAGGAERRFSVLPFAGGSETPLNISGSPRGAIWADSVTVSVSSPTATGARVTLLDVRTGAATRSTEISDSLAQSVIPLPDGWAWIPATRDRVVVQHDGKTTNIPKASWFGELVGLRSDPTGQRLAMTGWNAGTYDSVGVAVVPAAGGTPVLWATSAAEQVGADFLNDGSILFAPWDTPESAVLYKVSGPGRLDRLGAVTRPIAGISVSNDLGRIAVLESNYHGDAFMSRIVRP
jgi:hypothetical protein